MHALARRREPVLSEADAPPAAATDARPPPSLLRAALYSVSRVCWAEPRCLHLTRLSGPAAAAAQGPFCPACRAAHGWASANARSVPARVPAASPQVLKHGVRCYAQVTSVAGAAAGAAATVRLALVLPADAWAEHRRWAPSKELLLHLSPLGGQGGSCMQRMEQEVAALREPPPGADPFRWAGGAGLRPAAAPAHAAGPAGAGPTLEHAPRPTPHRRRSLAACFQCLPMKSADGEVPPLRAADPSQLCLLAEVGAPRGRLQRCRPLPSAIGPALRSPVPAACLHTLLRRQRSVRTQPLPAPPPPHSCPGPCCCTCCACWAAWTAPRWRRSPAAAATSGSSRATSLPGSSCSSIRTRWAGSGCLAAWVA